MSYQPYNNFNDNAEGGGFTTYNNNDGDGQGSQGKTQQRNTIKPVTIKQINDSKTIISDGEFVVNGVELNMVSFVGIIRNVNDNTSSLTVTIEDGTGSLDVRKWVDEGSDPSENNYPLGQYVYVTGLLKEFNEKKSLQQATINPIEDYNQVTYHYLSAIKVHVEANQQGSHQQGNSLFVSQNADDHTNSNDPSEKVYRFIHDNTPSMVEGVPIQYIAQSLSLTDNEVINYCNQLSDVGKIYNGNDDSSYLAV
ncbi:hypothetical protein LJB42_000893 [Komagataella kurtzmanii]|nr:hypothetical protein LJB42_000893 [Komagataella kurtzmanii]